MNLTLSGLCVRCGYGWESGEAPWIGRCASETYGGLTLNYDPLALAANHAGGCMKGMQPAVSCRTELRKGSSALGEIAEATRECENRNAHDYRGEEKRRVQQSWDPV